MIVYAQTSGQHSTNNANWTAIPNLSVTLPRGVGESALLVLNVPNPYAQGNNYPGGNFGLQVNGTVQSPVATFTYNEQNPPSTGRIPTTLSVVVPLSQTADSSVVAVWSGVRGSTVIIDSPATLTAVIA
jgi:mannose-binding lectin